ncbi:MAG: hypothetical protein ACK5KM_06105 [Hyphomicrobiaceae bacterium]
MGNAQFIASLIGPSFIVIASVMLLRRAYFIDLTARMSEDRATIFLAGLLAFVAGLAILRVHNLWVADWRISVTIFGWLAIFGGIFRMAFADSARNIRDQFAAHHSAFTATALLILAIGSFFTFAAYGFIGTSPA